ncbi:hypothetical protein B5C34_00195 [Pacificimonas flava]|uniref:Transmembrane protein n=1 Tax=Pacificimonas flava TaxID=1234595 RepID=A0A219B8Q1_9SPHN|nr:hypothetical protein B5C34_00195 [Pacificimonas flava]
MTALPGPQDVLAFWFEESGPEQWFAKDAAFDEEIRRRFGTLREALAAHVPDDWLATADGLLAAIIVLDQFSRNLFRGSPRAFATDTDALNLTNLAIERGWDRDFAQDRRVFLYMPFMHCEDAYAQQRSVELFEDVGAEENLEFAKAHRDVIDRFGRFPGRNEALGRTSTPEELAYLQEGGGF